MIAALLAFAAVQEAPLVVPEGDDIVVRAVRRKCRVEMTRRALSGGEFDRYAKEWAAGRPVRVFAPADADIKCLAKIAFRLADRGVRRITFVEPRDGIPLPP